MAEYIDRKAAIDVVTKWFKKINLNGDICIDGDIDTYHLYNNGVRRFRKTGNYIPQLAELLKTVGGNDG